MAFLANAAALYTVFALTPVEVQMGAVQKIFYYHVPSAMMGYLMVFLAFLFSLMYLVKEDPLYDQLAFATAEVGWVFITVVLVTGPIWGRSAWGKWWVWEPRLTTALILWLLYSSYFLLRLFSRHDARAARIAAVLAVVAFFDVPVVHQSIKWWGTVVHPKKVLLDLPMKQAFALCAIAVFLFATALALTRVWVGLLEERRAARLTEE
jgi:heme exporter protein C